METHHMKSVIRTVLVGGLAMLALNLASAGVAAAATAPEFKPVPAKKKLRSTSGAVKWVFNNGTESVECAKSTMTGELTGARTLGKAVMVLSECTTSGSGGSGCAVNSVGAKAGEIVTKPLDGELGTVAVAEGPSGVGILLKPETAKIWATLATNSCLPELNITGSAAAEIAVIGKKQVTNGLVFSVPSGKQAIKAITLDSGKLEHPGLVMLGDTATMAGTDEVTFEEALEVT